MKIVLALALAALSGCSTLNNHGIGGRPELVCSKSGQAHIDDRLVGSDSVHLTLIRRFEGADSACVVKQ